MGLIITSHTLTGLSHHKSRPLRSTPALSCMHFHRVLYLSHSPDPSQTAVLHGVAFGTQSLNSSPFFTFTSFSESSSQTLFWIPSPSCSKTWIRPLHPAYLPAALSNGGCVCLHAPRFRVLGVRRGKQMLSSFLIRTSLSETPAALRWE